MAFEFSDGGSTPHATNYSDLLDKLITFLTVTNTDWLLHNDQRGSTGEVTLKGTGLGGTDNIYVGIKLAANAPADIYGWLLQGYTGFTGAGFLNNPGAITGAIPAVSLWNSTIPYWFFANGRRFIVIAKVNNIYVSMYAGHILPYGSSGQWFYPLCIGGSTYSDIFGAAIVRYSDTSDRMACPFIPLGSNAGSQVAIRAASGVWVRIYNSISTIQPPGTGGGQQLFTGHGVFPYVQYYFNNHNGWGFCRPNQAGDYPLLPLRLCRYDTPDILGIYDNAYYTSGYNVTSEDVVTVGSDDYLIFQDTFRTGLISYFAVKKV